jgi:apolipoprotein D and lipocalin family protein
MILVTLRRGLAVCVACCAMSVHAAAPVASVSNVDLARYVGKWYEIASFPMFFQRHCIGDTTAQYAETPDGSVAVINRCRTKAGFDEAHGTANVVEGFGNGRLKVSFFWPFRADYWIIGLDADYRWAVVGNPNRKYLWVLSRTPQLPRALLDATLKSAESQGFDLTKLRYTAQDIAAAPP